FDGMGEYLGPYLQERVNGVTTEMYPVGPNSIAGTGYEVTLTNGRLTSLRYYVGRFDSSAVPSIEYHELFSDLSTADVYREMDLLDFCAEQGGTVFVVTDVTDYRITVFSADGSVERAIEPGVARLPKTDEEIRSEIEEFDDSHTGDRAYTGGYEPSPYHPLIELAGVDGDGRLWVRRLDAAEGYLFDVWDSMGSLACQVMLEDVAGDLELTFHVDRYGVLGANLDSDWHPRVYMLVLDDSERSELQRNPGTAENHT
ncbi:hypothetical protein JW921_11280, partial [Candidatus Fermentibacterales bacterium]|nr:hypothetical protein [Candidatus Fermentibacterales bacterium]